jgi:hypothetical protein
VPPLPVLTFIRWNLENVRGYEKADRCSFFNKVDFYSSNDQKGPARLKIVFKKVLKSFRRVLKSKNSLKS